MYERFGGKMKRIAIIADNSCEYVSKILISWNDNDVPVLIDFRTPVHACVEMIDKADAKIVYTDKVDLYNHLTSIRTDIMVELIDSDIGAVNLPDIIRNLYKKRYDNEEAVILFSSGTTGGCKGVRLSHMAITTNAEKNAARKRVDNNSVLYVYKTLSHCASFVGELLLGLITGANIYVCSVRTMIRMHLENICKYNVTHFSVNPSVLHMIVINEKKRYNYSALEMVSCSGALLDKKCRDMAQKFFGCKVVNMYGMTEVSSLFSCRTIEPKKDPMVEDDFESVGIPLEENKVRIWNFEAGVETMEGEIGEVQIFSPTLMLGYLGEERIDIDREGYWNTGDLGYINSDGELFIVGRKDRMIISCGHNIYPEYIEHLIKQSGLVDECVVFGEKDELYGEKICCMYTCKDKIEKVEDHLRKECIKYLAQYEVPHCFRECAGFSHTSTGKIVVK